MTGLVPRFPTLIVGMFGLLAALLMFIAGVILSNQLSENKRDFEYKLVMVENLKRGLKKDERDN